MTIVMHCNCYSDYQNRVYGEGKRLHNPQFKDRKHLKKARCTVCGVSRETTVAPTIQRNRGENHDI